MTDQAGRLRWWLLPLMAVYWLALLPIGTCWNIVGTVAGDFGIWRRWWRANWDWMQTTIHGGPAERELWMARVAGGYYGPTVGWRRRP